MDRETRQIQKKFSTELFSTWAESWGLSLAFAVTQSVDEAEKVVSEAIVALVARKTGGKHSMALDDSEAEFEPADFAAAIWQIATPKAFQGFGADSFFKLPVLTRAVVMLKLRAKFSRQQIADSLGISPNQIESHLESARLLHSSGRSWLVPSTAANTDAAQSALQICPQWERVYEIPHKYVQKPSAKTDFLQEIFDRYVGNDLDNKTSQALHGHLVSCDACRTGFVHFRKTYNDWITTIPVVEADESLRKHLNGVSRSAARTLIGRPNPWIALRALSRNWQIRVIGVLFLLNLLYVFLKRH